jgi:hypothetical protein
MATQDKEKAKKASVALAASVLSLQDLEDKIDQKTLEYMGQKLFVFSRMLINNIKKRKRKQPDYRVTKKRIDKAYTKTTTKRRDEKWTSLTVSTSRWGHQMSVTLNNAEPRKTAEYIFENPEEAYYIGKSLLTQAVILEVRNTTRDVNDNYFSTLLGRNLNERDTPDKIIADVHDDIFMELSTAKLELKNELSKFNTLGSTEGYTDSTDESDY